jgi:hypothetical protein
VRCVGLEKERESRPRADLSSPEDMGPVEAEGNTPSETHILYEESKGTNGLVMVLTRSWCRNKPGQVISSASSQKELFQI